MSLIFFCCKRSNSFGGTSLLCVCPIHLGYYCLFVCDVLLHEHQKSLQNTWIDDECNGVILTLSITNCSPIAVLSSIFGLMQVKAGQNIAKNSFALIVEFVCVVVDIV